MVSHTISRVAGLILTPTGVSGVHGLIWRRQEALFATERYHRFGDIVSAEEGHDRTRCFPPGKIATVC